MIMLKYFPWLILAFYIFSTAKSQVLVPCVEIENRTVCYCTRNKTYVDCSSQGLKRIPEISFKFEVLNFRNNSLKQLRSNMFSHVHTKDVMELSFPENEINYIEENSLSVFKHLSILDLSSNPLNNSILRNALWNISESLQEIDLSNLSLWRFEFDLLFEPLQHTKLLNLSLRHNNFIKVVMNNTFKYLQQLKVFDLSYNHIGEIQIVASKTLTILRLSGNQLTSFPKLCRRYEKKSIQIYPNLEELYIEKNCIYKIASFKIDCLKNLQLLNISNLQMKVIPNNLFSKLTSLKELYIEHSDNLRTIQPLAFNSSSLTTLFLRNNKLYFYEPYVNPRSLFVNTPNLKLLDITDNILGKMSEKDWTHMLRRVPQLLFLGISQGEIQSLPKVVPKYLQNLVDFRAEYNGITEIPSKYLLPLKKLKYLYLNSNKLSRIYDGELPKSLKKINLAYNPYVCDCRLIWFKNFIEKQRQIFMYYPRRYLCENGQPVANFRITIKSCLLSQKINTIVMRTCMGIVCLVLGFSGVYRYRWRLRYFIHVLNLQRREYLSSYGQIFLHDIYVVCSNLSWEAAYIKENLVSTLENDGKTVFFPPHDVLPNKPEVTEMLEQMDRSKYILICISDAFSSDHLCDFQVNMALQRSIHDRDCKVIVVILEELCVDNVNKTINHLLRVHQDYLLWDEEEEANVLFWRKFNEYIE